MGGEAKIGYPKGSNGERVQKLKVFGLFFYDTPFKNCIFSMDALIARRSKYDFWIPDEILTLEKKNRSKKYFFEIENFDRKTNPDFFFGSKKISHPKIEFRTTKCRIDFFDFWMGIFFGPKKKSKNFFDQNFRSRKNIFLI